MIKPIFKSKLYDTIYMYIYIRYYTVWTLNRLSHYGSNCLILILGHPKFFPSSLSSLIFLLFTPDFVFLKKWYPIIGRLLYSVSPGLFYLLNRKSEIGTLHLEFDTGYDSVIRSIVESEIKNAATSISVNNFRFQRTSLEKYFHNKIKERLEGK